jgi:hypothetical protein
MRTSTPESVPNWTRKAFEHTFGGKCKIIEMALGSSQLALIIAKNNNATGLS